MTLKYISENYNVPADRGQRVISHDGTRQRSGTIIGARGQLLRVRFDGEDDSELVHPRRKLDYVREPGKLAS